MAQKKKNIFRIFISFALIFIHMVPLYITTTMAFKEKIDMSSLWKIPSYFYLGNFKESLENNGVINAMGNTLFITVISLIIIVFIGSMAAYPLARIKSRGMFVLQMSILGLMMIPGLTTLVPLYSMFVKIGGVNTYWGVILIHVTNQLPMAIFLYANFMRTIPQDYDEAALVDGCSKLMIFYRIILPQLKGVTASILILCGIKIWNDYAVSVYFLQNPKIETITLAISNSFQAYSSNLNVAAASALLCVSPVLIIYILMQRYFISGEADGGVKG